MLVTKKSHAIANDQFKSNQQQAKKLPSLIHDSQFHIEHEDRQKLFMYASMIKGTEKKTRKGNMSKENLCNQDLGESTYRKLLVANDLQDRNHDVQGSEDELT